MNKKIFKPKNNPKGKKIIKLENKILKLENKIVNLIKIAETKKNKTINTKNNKTTNKKK